MEHFAQTDVFARIRTVFARIRTVFAHLIIGCAIRYPKIGNLRYMCLCVCLPMRLLIASVVTWIQYEWLNKFYSFNMAGIVIFISRCGLKSKCVT